MNKQKAAMNIENIKCTLDVCVCVRVKSPAKKKKTGERQKHFMNWVDSKVERIYMRMTKTIIHNMNNKKRQEKTVVIVSARAN